MELQHQVLDILQTTCNYISGAQIARQLQVSRNSIWKAINALKQQGYIIDAVRNRGYRLSAQSDVISPQAISPLLQADGPIWSIQYLPHVRSTNDTIRQLAEQHAPEGTVVIAGEQTNGKGRMNRTFYSPKHTGIYMSLLLRPKIPLQQATFITTAAAVAAAQAIQSVTGAQVGIKWVNDLYYNNKKVCGILTEAAIDIEGGGLRYAVLGIGINISPPKDGFPEHLRTIAGSLLQQPGVNSVRAKIIAAFLNRFGFYYTHLSEKTFMAEYRSRSIVLGKQVQVLLKDGSKTALVTDIDNNVNLHVQYADGGKQVLASGEISIQLGEI